MSTAGTPVDSKTWILGTGRRKESVARVFLRPGSGKFTVNRRPVENYFPNHAWPELRPSLRKNGFLTRDSRMKERKKYGQKGARKRFQFTKR